MSEQNINSDLIRGHIDTIILKILRDGDNYGYEITADSTDQTQAPATTEQNPESNEKAASGIPTLHIILFAGGMVIAIGTLIVMQILKKKRENEAPDDEEDEE